MVDFIIATPAAVCSPATKQKGVTHGFRCPEYSPFSPLFYMLSDRRVKNCQYWDEDRAKRTKNGFSGFLNEGGVSHFCMSAPIGL